jgi:hypothetical protein
MSLHKIPLTELEKLGLEKHKLPTDKPSQLSDCFRLGVQHATQNFNETVIQLCKEKNTLQAKVDSLMLEFCPEEMTQEQIENWEQHHVVSTHSNIRIVSEESFNNLVMALSSPAEPTQGLFSLLKRGTNFLETNISS